MKRKWNVWSLLFLLPLLIVPVQATAGGEGSGTGYLVAVGISFLIALIVVSILKAGMKNVQTKWEARGYESRPLNLTHRADRFTHTTTSRRKLETKSHSGVR